MIEDEDEDTIIDLMGAVSANFLLRIYPPQWVSDRFGRNPSHVCIPKVELAAHVNLLVTPPAVSLGLIYPPFAFPDDAQEADEFNELLSEISCMSQRFELHFEDSETAPQEWLEHYLDLTLAARFLPLIRAHDGDLLVHGPHFEVLLAHLEQHPTFAAVLSRPRGPNHELLMAKYNTLTQGSSG